MAAKRKTAELSGTAEAQTKAAEAPKPPRTSGSGRSGLGVGALARSLIVERPDWTYRRIAEEVNARIAVPTRRRSPPLVLPPDAEEGR